MPDSPAEVFNQPKRTEISELNQRKRLPQGVKVRKKGDNGLNRDSFLKLLVKELSNQDPLQPVNDKEFISQMAQFSALEQMHNVSKSVNKLTGMQANNLVGKFVSGKDFVTGKLVSGKVKTVIHDSAGNSFLRVNGRSVKVDDVTSVSEANVSRETLSGFQRNYRTETISANKIKSQRNREISVPKIKEGNAK